MHRLAELLGSGGQFLLERESCLVLFGWLGEPNLALGDVLEDAVERVIVGGWDRVEFVVVATGAGGGQAHRAAANHVDPVVDDVVRDPEKSPPDGQESHRREGRLILGLGLIGGDLIDEEAVVGHVVVERLHHPIAIGRGLHEKSLLAGVDISLGVGISGDVEPMPPPLLAVSRRGEQAIDELFIGVGGGVVNERADFLGSRRQAGEVERHAADQVLPARGRRV